MHDLFVALRRVAPLLLLLLLIPVVGSARAEGPTVSVTGAGGLVNASAAAKKSPSRTFGVVVTTGPDGKPRGTITFADRDARLRARAEKIDQVTVVDNVATLIGSARVG